MIKDELLKRAKLNDIDAMLEVAKYYYNSDADDNHAEVAVGWLNKILQLDPLCGVAWSILANCYCYGYGIEQDIDRGLACYGLAIEQKDAMACYNLAECYRTGFCVDKEIDKAIKYYALAGEYGKAEGWEMIGEIYQEGEEIGANYDIANEYFRKGMEEGCSTSFYSMALAYEYALGVQQDSKKAAELWETAAELDHCGAKYITGMNYLNGSGVNANLNRALYWLDSSARQGHCDAAYQLGEMYYKGIEGVSENLQKAKEYYYMSAKLEKVEAMEKLGHMLYEENEYDESLYWFREGAERGNQACMRYAAELELGVAKLGKNTDKYGNLLDTIECLAKVGAALGRFNDFFMYIACEKDQVYIHQEVKFGDFLKRVKSSPELQAAHLGLMGITQSEFEFFMKNIQIESKDESHDVGELLIVEYLKRPEHCREFYESLKSRLISIKYTKYSVNQKGDVYQISLFDE